MLDMRLPVTLAAHELAGGHRRVKLVGLALMLLLHCLIVGSVFYGKSPARRIQPMRNAVAATLLAGSAQPEPSWSAASAATPEPPAPEPPKEMAPLVVEPPPSPRQPEPSKAEPVAASPKTRPVRPDRPAEPRPTPSEQAAHPDHPARVAAAAPPATSSASALSKDSMSASSASSDKLSAPAATIAPGVHCKTPEYPKASRRLTEEGIVALRFLVDRDGRVLNAEVERSSGYSRLDDAARNALSLCQFRPGEIDGKPVQSWARINYSWKLK